LHYEPEIVLAAAEGQTNKAIAETNAITLDKVRLWRNRWVKLQNISLNE